MENTSSRSQYKTKEPKEIRREVTIQSLLESGAHFGTTTSTWHPKMAPFIYGIRRGRGRQNAVYIINLESTIKMWKRARQAIVDNISNGGELLFVGTKDAIKNVVVEEATKVDSPYVESKWLGGMLTNLDVLRRSIVKLTKLEDFILKADSPDSAIALTKKEILNIRREIEGLTKKFGGVRKLKKPPTMVFITDVVKNKLALFEAKRLCIPVVALVDTNVDPAVVNFPIPANDDSNSSQALFIRCVADAVAEGKALLEAKRQAAQSAVELKEGPPAEEGELVQSLPSRDVKVEVKRRKS